MNRYILTKIVGIPIDPSTAHYESPGNAKPTTEFYILDRFQAYKVCAVFGHKNKEELARRTCHEWNAEERAWEKGDPRD